MSILRFDDIWSPANQLGGQFRVPLLLLRQLPGRRQRVLLRRRQLIVVATERTEGVAKAVAVQRPRLVLHVGAYKLLRQPQWLRRLQYEDITVSDIKADYRLWHIQWSRCAAVMSLLEPAEPTQLHGPQTCMTEALRPPGCCWPVTVDVTLEKQ